MVQGKDDTLRDYLTRFNKESLKIKDLEPSFALAALNSGLKDNFPFTLSLMKKPAQDMADLLKRAEKYVNADEAMEARKQKTSWTDQLVEKEEHLRSALGKNQKMKEKPELTKDDRRHKLTKRKESPKRGTPIPNSNNSPPPWRQVPGY
ncbi:hypothetical protein CFOL_v3_06774 [Cephalotus follicularis]|uniref:Uncharacterized protein n=1 Tax=Cephalotus follicularis TaxID=3775 RepID=A0A1Q3B5V7_CEPFO|nr:hypothetical protein CFOL_v3_06774 [Cephalotus follicularis]